MAFAVVVAAAAGDFVFLQRLLSVKFFIRVGWSRITRKNGSFTVNETVAFSFTGADGSKK